MARKAVEGDYMNVGAWPQLKPKAAEERILQVHTEQSHFWEKGKYGSLEIYVFCPREVAACQHGWISGKVRRGRGIISNQKNVFTTLRKSMHIYKKITTNFLKQGRGWQSKANRTFLEFCPFGRARASLNFEGNSYSSTGLWAGLNFNLILPDLVSWEVLSSYVTVTIMVETERWNWLSNVKVKLSRKS